MRYGGVSEGLFESLNGKKGTGDLNSNVDENRRRALAAVIPAEAGIQKEAAQLAHIIHQFKTNILEAKRAGVYEGFDASYTTSPDVILSQTTADCGSIIITDTKGSVVALVHGSWHTLRDKIICETIAKLKEHTANELVAGLGPMICKNCYEFGAEAKELFDPKYLSQLDPVRHPVPTSVIPAKAGIQKTEVKHLVDLKQMIIDQLSESGITKIDDVNICTLEDKRFFSHRRSGAKSGRMITLTSL